MVNYNKCISKIRVGDSIICCFDSNLSWIARNEPNRSIIEEKFEVICAYYNANMKVSELKIGSNKVFSYFVINTKHTDFNYKYVMSLSNFQYIHRISKRK